MKDICIECKNKVDGKYNIAVRNAGKLVIKRPLCDKCSGIWFKRISDLAANREESRAETNKPERPAIPDDPVTVVYEEMKQKSEQTGKEEVVGVKFDKGIVVAAMEKARKELEANKQCLHLSWSSTDTGVKCSECGAIPKG